jgi:hypothetical protein
MRDWALGRIHANFFHQKNEASRNHEVAHVVDVLWKASSSSTINACIVSGAACSIVVVSVLHVI